MAASNFSCASSKTAAVTVYVNPVASFTTVDACFGKENSFVNQSSIAAGNQITSYAWSFGNGSYTNSINALHTYAAPGTYSVVLTAVSNHNCTNSFTSIATVHHIPNTNFSANYACYNQTSQFNNSSSIAVGNIAKIRWDFENDGVWDDTLNANPAIVYANSGNHSAKLQTVSNFQCESSKINPAVVYANPIANFINKPACLGDVSTFTNTSTSSDGAITSYQWDFNGDNMIDNTFMNPSFTYTTNGIYLLKLEVQTEHGCVNVKSKSMYVNPKPIPLFSTPTRTSCPPL
jgi:PKD repeat protein